MEYRPAWFGLRWGTFTGVQWLVAGTLCDPMRQVTLCSFAMGFA